MLLMCSPQETGKPTVQARLANAIQEQTMCGDAEPTALPIPTSNDDD